MLDSEAPKRRQRSISFPRNHEYAIAQVTPQPRERADQHRLVTEIAVSLAVVDEYAVRRHRHFQAAQPTMLGHDGSCRSSTRREKCQVIRYCGEPDAVAALP